MHYSPNFFLIGNFVQRYKKKISSIAILMFVVMAVIASFSLFGSSQAATYTWDGGGADNNWSTVANWSTDTVPGAGDIAIFDGTSIKNATIDAGHVGSVAGIQINAGYTGIITQARTLTVGTSHFSQAAGTFTGSADAITVNGNFTTTGGTFTSTSGIIDFNGNVDLSAGGTFAHNSGTVTFSSTGNENFDVATSLTLNNLHFNQGPNDRVTIGTSDTIIVSGLLTFTDGNVYGTSAIVRATGTISSPITGLDGGTATLEIACACAVTNSGTSIMPLHLNHASASYTNSNSGTQDMEGNMNIALGTFNAGSGTSQIWGNLTVNSSATFNHDSGTVLFDPLFDSAVDPIVGKTITVDGSIAFNNLTFREDNYTIKYTFTAGTVSSVAGTLTNTVNFGGAKALLVSDTPGSVATINFASSNSVNDVGFTDITNAGVGTITCIYRCEDGGGNTTGTLDIGTANVTIGNLSSFTTTEAGGTSTVTVRLDRLPSASVTITPTSSDTGEIAVTPSSMTFTTGNYYTEQTFTFTGVDDALDDGAQSSAITFASTSGDASYSGIAIDSRTVINIDGDTDTASIDFDTVANFTAQDVKNTGTDNVGYFVFDYFGDGNFTVSSGGADSDISGGDIKAGCVVDIAGTNYQIVAVTDESIGYIRITPYPVTDAEYAFELVAPSGVVNSIRCTGDLDDSNAGTLTTGWVNSRSVANIGETGFATYYDSLNDAIWTFDSAGTDFIHLDESSLVQTTVSNPAIASSGSEYGAVVDQVRGRLWYPNRSTDTIVAFDGATGGYAFGTSGASTFTVSDQVTRATYDATQDAIWTVGDGTSATLYKLNASNGAFISSTDISSLGTINATGIAHDPTENAIWISYYKFSPSETSVVKFDATDGTAFGASLAASTYSTNQDERDQMDGQALFNETLGEFYVPISYCNTQATTYTVLENLAIIDSTDGSTVGHIQVPPCISQAVMDETNDKIYYAREFGASVVVVDLATRTYKEYYGPETDMNSLLLDDDGDVWVNDEFYDSMYEMVFDGVPTSSYYTVTTKAASELDTTAETSLSTVAVDETLDSANIYYALSFNDNESFVIPAATSRPIATHASDIHGGVNGNWYYRDNASVWTAAPSNSAEEAVSLAVAAGSNNRMTGTALSALDSTSLEGGDAFNGGSTSSINVSATFYSTDAHNAPVVNDLTFTFAAAASSGGSTPSILTTNESITVDSCSPSTDIILTLGGNNIKDYLLTEDAGLSGASWATFDTSVPFTLSEGDGVKTIYAKFRSSTGNQSGLFSVEVILDEATVCEDVVVEPVNGTEEESLSDDTSDSSNTPTGSDTGTGSSESGNTSGGGFGSFLDLNFVDCLGEARTILAAERNTYMFGIARIGKSTPNGFPSQISQVDPGDYIRSESFDTVYCVTENLERRPFVGETDYFTHTRSFLQTRWVADETMAALPLVGPMLPKIGTSLLKFESTNNVYLHDENLEDSTKGLLYWITTEELARVMIGATWADFVIDVSPALFPRFDFGDPLITSREVDTTDLRERELLNEEAANAEKTEEDIIAVGFLERFRSIILGK